MAELVVVVVRDGVLSNVCDAKKNVCGFEVIRDS